MANKKRTLHRVSTNDASFVDVEEAAAISGLTPWWLRELARRGEMGAKRLNGRWWFDESQVANKNDEIVLTKYANLADL